MPNTPYSKHSNPPKKKTPQNTQSLIFKKKKKHIKHTLKHRQITRNFALIVSPEKLTMPSVTIGMLCASGARRRRKVPGATKVNVTRLSLVKKNDEFLGFFRLVWVVLVSGFAPFFGKMFLECSSYFSDLEGFCWYFIIMFPIFSSLDTFRGGELKSF